jgi:predicted amidohydrolase
MVSDTFLLCAICPRQQNKAEELVRKAAAQGANIILIQELFEARYFCQEQHSVSWVYFRDSDSTPENGRLHRQELN